MNKLTDRIMDTIADSLSTKTCFLIFCFIAFVPLFFQYPADLLGWDQYISQTVIQLVTLSVLAIVAKKEGRAQQKMLQETHDCAMEELAIGREERADMKQLMEEIHKNTKEGNCIGL